MSYRSLGLAAAIVLAFAGAGYAQESTTTETTTEATAAEGTAAGTDDTKLDEEFPVAEENSEPQVGDGYLKTTHGEWEVRCIKAPENEPETCRLYNLLNDADGASVAEMNLQALPKGGKAVAGVDIVTPLGSLLTAQVQMRIDAGKVKRYPYSWCDQFGCIARFGMTAGEIASLKKGAKAVVTIAAVANPKEPISLDVSLSGFTAAWTDIEPK